MNRTSQIDNHARGPNQNCSTASLQLKANQGTARHSHTHKATKEKTLNASKANVGASPLTHSLTHQSHHQVPINGFNSSVPFSFIIFSLS